MRGLIVNLVSLVDYKQTSVVHGEQMNSGEGAGVKTPGYDIVANTTNTIGSKPGGPQFSNANPNRLHECTQKYGRCG